MELKKHLIAAFIIMLMPAFALAQQPGFVQQDIIKVEGITTDAQVNSSGPVEKTTTRVYYDGLGRTLQTVAIQASPAGNDLIQPVAYDNLGRQTIGYLPYAGNSTDAMGSYRPNAISTDQPGFYNQTGQYLIPVDAAPYNSTVFEDSPLQRVLQSGMVGTGFQPGSSGSHYKTVNYRSNNSSDGNILLWNLDGTYAAGSYYAANTLSVIDGTDEDGVETVSFTDLTGHTILKRQLLSTGNLDTYYLYNIAGMIKYVIPPLATAKLSGVSYNLATAPVSNLIFKYEYDSRGRVIQKTVPSKGLMSIVYDPYNRPVLIQDGYLNANNEWNYIKYDVKNRPISQGIYLDLTHTGQAAMQAYVNSLTYTTWYESRSSTNTQGGYYTNNVFPSTNLTPHAFAYYGDYYMTQGISPDFSYVTQGDPNLPNEETATTAQLKGMPTIICKTTVGAGLSNTWLTTVMFYDKNLHVIQTRSNNHLYYTNATTLTDTKTAANDFTGTPLYTKISKQTAASVSSTVYTKVAYDPVHRVQSIRQIYNTGSYKIVAAYSYNELGQVIKKGLGYVNSTTNLQNVNMRYNIRDQLLNINNSKLANDGGVTSNDSNDLFGMQMLYNTTDAGLTYTPYQSGKLSAVKWMSKNATGASSYERAFIYSYDNVNRYTGSDYLERPTASTMAFINTHGWDESGITYDQNGNILTLQRYSSSQGAGTSTQIDNLTYSYVTSSPNLLNTVSDGTDTVHTNNGFRNLTGSPGNYTYNYNGNLTADPYKGISTMAYNVLNRINNMTITSGGATGRFIRYTYDADGNIIRKQAYDNSVLQTTTDYIDGFVYTTAGVGTPALSYFPMPEGRVVNTGSAFVQEFIITDSQGNARLSFQDNGSGTAVVKQENSYYAFGLIMPNSPVNTPAIPNKQLYNSASEWQKDYSNNLPDYYQTLNRNYDAALGRFIGTDPSAEGAESMTGYQYAGNNPVMYNDPLGNKFSANSYVPPGSHGNGYGEFEEEENQYRSVIFDSLFGTGFGGIPLGGGSDFMGIPGATNTTVYSVGDGTIWDPAVGTKAQGIQAINSIVAADGGKPIPGTIYVYVADNGQILGQHFTSDPNDGDFGVHFFRASTKYVSGIATIVGDGEISPLEAYQQITGNADFPVNEGFSGPPIYGDLAEGDIISRFGGTRPNSDYFSSREVPAALRNLLKGTDLNKYQEWRVLKAFRVRGGPIADENGEPNGEIQLKSEMSFEELEDGGFIEPIPGATPYTAPVEPIEIP